MSVIPICPNPASSLGISATGHYVTVWVKENGTWKVRADLGNTDPKKP